MPVRVAAALGATLLTSVAQAGGSHGGAATVPLSASIPDTPKSVSDPSDAPSDAVATLLRWVKLSGNNNGLPYMVIDKLRARVFIFGAEGKLLGSAPVLVGIARGDDAAIDVGSSRLRDIPLGQRTTPAGRFIARFGPAKGHPPVLWVDYADAIALHPVVTRNKKERRLQRIKSNDADDHRISFGCINVPAAFYARIVKPQFRSRNSSSVVYILPDTKTLADVFPGILLQPPDVSASARTTAAAN